MDVPTTRRSVFKDKESRLQEIDSEKTFSIVGEYAEEQELIRRIRVGEQIIFPTAEHPYIFSKDEIKNHHVAEVKKDSDGTDRIYLGDKKPANGQYIFVVMEDDQLRLAPRYKDNKIILHSFLSEFQPVKYAGEITLTNGRINLEKFKRPKPDQPPYRGIPILNFSKNNYDKLGFVDPSVLNINLTTGHYKLPYTMTYLVMQKFSGLIDTTEPEELNKAKERVLRYLDLLHMKDHELCNTPRFKPDI